MYTNTNTVKVKPSKPRKAYAEQGKRSKANKPQHLTKNWES